MDSIVAVLTMHDASWQWLAYQSARLALQEFGEEAGDAASLILSDPDVSVHPWHRLRAAIEVAAYEKSGFPVSRLQELASGRYRVTADHNLNFGFRLASLRALASRPRPELAGYWTALLLDPHGEIRQAAAVGLACAQGAGFQDALADLERSDRDPRVRKTAELTLRELVEQRDGAHVCLHGTWTRAQAASGELPADSLLVARAERHFGFRRR
jgi:HEAT repeat protein